MLQAEGNSSCNLLVHLEPGRLPYAPEDKVLPVFHQDCSGEEALSTLDQDLPSVGKGEHIYNRLNGSIVILAVDIHDHGGRFSRIVL